MPKYPVTYMTYRYLNTLDNSRFKVPPIYYISNTRLCCRFCNAQVHECKDCSIPQLLTVGRGGCSPDAWHCSCRPPSLRKGDFTPAYQSSDSPAVSPQCESESLFADSSRRDFCHVCNMLSDYCTSDSPCASSLTSASG